MKYMLHDIVKNYEFIDNDGSQQNEEDDKWGSCSLIVTTLVDGDNWGNFLTLGEKKPEIK